MNRATHIRNAHLTATAPAGALGIGWVNVGLAVAALVLLMFYVMQVNLATASTWQLKDVRAQLASASEARDTLVARQAQLDDRQTLLGLAAAQGMVPAGQVVYLVEPDSLATVR